MDNVSDDDDGGMVLNLGGADASNADGKRQRGTSKQRWLKQHKRQKSNDVRQIPSQNDKKISTEISTSQDNSSMPEKKGLEEEKKTNSVPSYEKNKFYGPKKVDVDKLTDHVVDKSTEFSDKRGLNGLLGEEKSSKTQNLESNSERIGPMEVVEKNSQWKGEKNKKDWGQRGVEGDREGGREGGRGRELASGVGNFGKRKAQDWSNEGKRNKGGGPLQEFHWADEKKEERTKQEIEEEIKKTVFAAENFLDLGLSPELSDHIKDHLGFNAPTHAQKAGIPAFLTGRDVIVKANTGTGKTLLYLAPIFHGLQSEKPRISRTGGTYALIIAPTRELCMQIHAVAVQLAKRFIWIVPGQVMGGENRNKEKARFRKGVTVLIATPGRLLDHLQHTDAFRISNLKYLILDEADRLLDLGFEKDVMTILEIVGKGGSNNSSISEKEDQQLPKDEIKHVLNQPQTALLSATLNTSVVNLAEVTMKDPLKLEVDVYEEFQKMEDSKTGKKESKKGRKGEEGEGEEEEEGVFGNSEDKEVFRIPTQLSQRYLKVPCRLRLVALSAFLRAKTMGTTPSKIVVFFSTCDAVEFHYSLFTSFRFGSPKSILEMTLNKGIEEDDSKSPLWSPGPFFKLHGNLTQKERAETFFAFGKSEKGVLLCTDVAARGLDFPTVSEIVQYDPAGEAEDYVHRVGRTARLGKKGEALLFLQPAEGDYIHELNRHKVMVQEQNLIPLLDTIPIGRRQKKGKNEPEVLPENHFGALALHTRLESFIARNVILRHLATDSFRSFVRAYAVHKGNLKKIFHPKRLHFGHVAKSFGLTDAPSLLGQSSTKLALKKEKKERAVKFKRKKLRLKPASMAE